MRHALPSSPIPLLSRLLQQHRQQQQELQQQLDDVQLPGATASRQQLQDGSGLLEVLILVSSTQVGQQRVSPCRMKLSKSLGFKLVLKYEVLGPTRSCALTDH